MRNRVLIASRDNEETAGRIRALLRSEGLEVEALDARQALGADAYAGPVLGSAIDLCPRSKAPAGSSAKAA
jgi:hypothetical protein